MQGQVDIRKEFRTISILSGAMMAAVCVYPIIVEVIKAQHEIFEGFAPHSVREKQEVFYAAALLVIVAIRFTRKSILKREPKDDMISLVRKLKISGILTFALCEVPAVLGLVLFLLGGYHREFYVLFLFSLLIMVLYFPRIRYWEAWLRRGK